MVRSCVFLIEEEEIDYSDSNTPEVPCQGAHARL